MKAFQNCLRENDIAPEDVIFVAHSTTQATNAFIEGDVANVGIVGVAGGGLEAFLRSASCLKGYCIRRKGRPDDQGI